MDTYFGENLPKALRENTFQEPYYEYIKCSKCNSISNPILLVDDIKGDLCRLPIKRNNGKPIWPHDSCSFALYMCSQCGHVDVDWNQG